MKGCEEESDGGEGLGQEHWERAGITVKRGGSAGRV